MTPCDMTSKSGGININSLTVRYGKNIQALDGIDLEISPGLFGLLGPNGAGKTTLMRVLSTLQKPTRGFAQVMGYDVERDAKQVRLRLGYLPQDFQTYPQLKAWEALDYYGILNGMTDGKLRRKRVDELLELVNLTPFRNRRVGGFSGGMRQRLGVAQALLTDPPVLIFDEPTAGLDPAERVHFRNFLGELSRDRIVILSTHIVADIGIACSRLAVLDRGHVRFFGSRDELIRQAQGKVWQITASDAEYARLRSNHTVTGMIDTEQGLEIRFLNDQKQDEHWLPVNPSMEDAYLWLIWRNENVH